MPDPIGGRSQTMADPNLAEIWRRSRTSVRPDRYWIITLDGTRLREARFERGLARDELAEGAGVRAAPMGGPQAQAEQARRLGTPIRVADIPAAHPSTPVPPPRLDRGAP